MDEPPAWSDLQRGIACPFDRPRAGIDAFMIEIATLTASTLYLSREQTYRGSSVLIFDPRHATRIDELSHDEWSSLAEDIGRAERAIYRTVEPDHVNVASLGSVMPHLHWHIIPRYRSDPRWGGPVWTTSIEEMRRTELSDEEYEELVAAIRSAL
jgi:diadenosine tetraphosphate (Ap4A) HIT family hydrolase